jgi:ATP-binding cassette subfamily C (CFTR/MRP) protein 1
LIFDDVFSGLDKATERIVFDRVFGRQGLIRLIGSTAVLSTHSVRHLPSADLIVALGRGGEVVQQGSYADLNAIDGYVQSLEVAAQSGAQPSDSPPTDSIKGSTPDAAESAAVDQTSSADGDLAVYKYYFAALGWARIAVLLLIFAVNSGSDVLLCTSTAVPSPQLSQQPL